MPDLDLAAVRADLATYQAPAAPGQPLVATAPLPLFAVNALGRILQEHLPALLTELARRDARITRLRIALAAERREAACFRAAHRDRQGLPSDPRHAVCRMADDDGFERAVLDRWHAASGADCPVHGCDGERIELEVVGKPSFVRLTCGHDPVPPAVGVVIDETHVWQPGEPAPLPTPASAPVRPPEPRDPTPAGAD
ncbi:hypothetical protein [Streptodolium elevatio]|uniref:Uncharacterized protein n=1 Tax=Streptodolium elevatio TaxID=3157996 RepID=A0ABV3DK50_9ACTN